MTATLEQFDGADGPVTTSSRASASGRAIEAREGPSAGTVDVTIIVMAWNEAATIAAVVEEIHAAMARHEWTYETLIVDDGSSDGTSTIAELLAERLAYTRVIHHGQNRGLGEVYRSGFAAARGDFITFLPADGQFEAAVVPQFLTRAQQADLVVGWIPDQRRPLLGRALSIAERVLYRVMFGPLPEFQGILMFRRALLEQLGIHAGGRGWGVLMELLVRARRAHLRIASEPTRLRPRTSGTSKVNNVRSAWANLRQAVALRRSL